MQPAYSVVTEYCETKWLQRMFGVCPGSEDRHIPLRRRLAGHTVAGGLLGLFLLHPLSMVAHALFHLGPFHVWQTIGVSFSYDHLAMAFYFTFIGVVFGLVHGVYVHIISQLYEEIRRQSITDELTGLYNRRFFDNRLDQELARARRYRHPLALLLLDIDHFKVYNDTHGHPAGDDLLETLGGLFQQLIRESDFAARYGGEEFAIVMPETGDDMAFPLAERICAAVSGHPFQHRHTQPGGRVTVSVGLAGFPGDARNGEELIRHVDQALYAAKTKGRNRVCRAETGHNDPISACERMST